MHLSQINRREQKTSERGILPPIIGYSLSLLDTRMTYCLGPGHVISSRPRSETSYLCMTSLLYATLMQHYSTLSLMHKSLVLTSALFNFYIKNQTFKCFQSKIQKIEMYIINFFNVCILSYFFLIFIHSDIFF